MSQNAHTPFDDPDNTGVPVPFSKNTQPLPPGGQPQGQAANPNSLLHGLQTGNSLNTPPQSAAPSYPPTAPPAAPSAPLHAPPAYPARPAAPVAASATPPDAPPRKPRVPLPTIIGLAVTGGVLLAIAIPSMMRRAIPTVEMKEPPPSVAVAAPNLTPRARPTFAADAVPIDPDGGAATDDGLAVGPDDPAAGEARSGAGRTSTSTTRTSSRTSTSRGTAVDPETRADSDDSQLPTGDSPSDDSSSAAERSVDEGTARNIDDTPVPGESEPDRAGSSEPLASEPLASDRSASRDTEVSNSGSTSVSSKRMQRASYSISPPAGWTPKRSGSRATWSGPSGAQLLVEESSDISGSPREGWEKLDRAFKKKYGRRYRSLGIRDATLAGLPASVWEFELDGRNGTTLRKIDIAAHAGGRGFAVLGSAPAGRFKQVRPQIEAAIESFQLKPGGSQRGDEPGF